MYCKYCGKELAQDEKFCTQCGKAVNQEEVSSFTPEEKNINRNYESGINYGIAQNPNLDQQTACKELLFFKKKMYGNITYKTTKTTLYIHPDFIKFQQSVKKIFVKENMFEKCIQLDVIQTVGIRTVLDFWDTFCGGILVICELLLLLQGNFREAFVVTLFAVVFLLCGYGKEIDMFMSDGSRLKIPFGNKGGSAEDLFAFIGYDKVTENKNKKGLIGGFAGIAVVTVLCLIIAVGSAESNIENMNYEGMNEEVRLAEMEEAAKEDEYFETEISETFIDTDEPTGQDNAVWEGNYVRTNGPTAFISIWSSEEDGVWFAAAVGVSGYAAYIDMRDRFGEWADTAIYYDGTDYSLSLNRLEDGSLAVYESQEYYDSGLDLSGIYIREESADVSVCEFVFPESHHSYLSENDCTGLTALECRIARNEIYARYGRRFSDESLQAYFDSCLWYEGYIEPDDFSEEVLNEIELANIDVIKAYEASQGF